MSDHFQYDEEDAPQLNPGANDSAAQRFDSLRPRLRVVPEPDDFDEEEFEASESLEARLEGTHGRAIAAFTPVGGPITRNLRSVSLPGERTPPSHNRQRSMPAGGSAPGIKRRTPKQIREDMPPTPRGCEWRRSDEGWNLWRYWSEPDETGKGRIKKTRYTGHLSHDAWQIMKEYNHETFLSIVGQRLRRHGRG